MFIFESAYFKSWNYSMAPHFDYICCAGEEGQGEGFEKLGLSINTAFL